MSLVLEAAYQEAQYEALYLGHYGVMEFRQPKYNTFFSPIQNAVTVFCRPGDAGGKWCCPVCGKKRGRSWFWTFAVPFYPAVPRGFVLERGDLCEPLTPVCADHPAEMLPGVEGGVA